MCSLLTTITIAQLAPLLGLLAYCKLPLYGYEDVEELPNGATGDERNGHGQLPPRVALVQFWLLATMSMQLLGELMGFSGFYAGVTTALERYRKLCNFPIFGSDETLQAKALRCAVRLVVSPPFCSPVLLHLFRQRL